MPWDSFLFKICVSAHTQKTKGNTSSCVLVSKVEITGWGNCRLQEEVYEITRISFLYAAMSSKFPTTILLLEFGKQNSNIFLKNVYLLRVYKDLDRDTS